MLYKQPPHPLKIDRLMGEGVYENDCKSCGKYQLLGDSKTCKSCVTTHNTRLVCFTCLHNSCSNCGRRDNPISGESQLCMVCESTSMWSEGRTKSFTVERCKLCKTIRATNDYQICEVCFNDRKNISACVKCTAPMIRKLSGQILCSQCRTDCISCGVELLSNFKTQKYCGVCSESIANGICTDCGDYDIALDEFGKCYKHSKARYEQIDTGEDSRTYCPNCEVTEVARSRELCKECIKQQIQCPNCLINDMEVDQFVCDDCYENISKEYE